MTRLDDSFIDVLDKEFSGKYVRGLRKGHDPVEGIIEGFYYHEHAEDIGPGAPMIRGLMFNIQSLKKGVEDRKYNFIDNTDPYIEWELYDSIEEFEISKKPNE